MRRIKFGPSEEREAAEIYLRERERERGGRQTEGRTQTGRQTEKKTQTHSERDIEQDG